MNAGLPADKSGAKIAVGKHLQGVTRIKQKRLRFKIANVNCEAGPVDRRLVSHMKLECNRVDQYDRTEKR